MNLTAVRVPEQIVQRHFGESLFAARHLLARDSELTVIDVGSGAGFPGIPLKIFSPRVELTLIEAHGKKATFLREVCRALALTNTNVLSARAEASDQTAELVTLRAVERFDQVLEVGAALVRPGGRLALLIGAAQSDAARRILSDNWSAALPIPGSRERVLISWTKP